MNRVHLTLTEYDHKYPRLSVIWQEGNCGQWVGEGVVWLDGGTKESWGHVLQLSNSSGHNAIVTLNAFGPGGLGILRFPCLNIDVSHLTLVSNWAYEVIRRHDIKGEALLPQLKADD